jgi:uncharacterized protein YukE
MEHEPAELQGMPSWVPDLVKLISGDTEKQVGRVCDEVSRLSSKCGEQAEEIKQLKLQYQTLAGTVYQQVMDKMKSHLDTVQENLSQGLALATTEEVDRQTEPF